jgi:hypothetical protein
VKKAVIIVFTSFVHFALTIGLAIKTFDLNFVFFGIYPKPNHGTAHGTLVAAYNILMFPLGRLAESLDSSVGFLGWPLMILNSLLWAMVIYLLVIRWFVRTGGRDGR